MVAMKPLRDLIFEAEHRDLVAERVWESADFTSCGGQVNMSKLLRSVCHDRATALVASQIVSRVSTWIQRSIWRALNMKTAPRGTGVRADYDSLEDAMHNPNSLDRHTLKAALGGMRVSGRFLSLTLVSDKASVCGVSLGAGAFVWPDSRCALAVPQASVVS